MRLSPWGTAVCLLCGVVPASAQSFSLEPAWNLRLRHEQVNDDAFARSARADTLRLRAGLRFAFDTGWLAYIEGEDIVAADGYARDTRKIWLQLEWSGPE